MTSVSDGILAKIETALGAVVWDPAPATAFTIESRKRLELPSVTPGIVVARDGVESTIKIHATRRLVTYPVAIGIGIKEAAKLADTTFTNWRQQTLAAVLARAAWAGLAGFNRVTDRPTGTLVKIKDGWIWSTMGFAVEVLQTSA